MQALFRNNYLKLILGVFLFASASSLEESELFNANFEKICQNFQKTLEQKEASINIEMDSILLIRNSKEKTAWEKKCYRLKELASSKGLFIHLYRSDSLVFWSSNQIPLNNFKPSYFKQNTAIKLTNAWYEVLHKKSGDYNCFGFILIKHEYPYENKHLRNDFQQAFTQSHFIDIAEKKTRGAIAIYNQLHQPLFFLKPIKNPNEIYTKLILITLLNAMALLLVVLFLIGIFRQFEKTIGRNWSMILLFCTLTALRALAIYFHFPPAFYELELFNPEHYAASAFSSSLGDLFLNVLLILFISYYWRNKFRLKNSDIARSIWMKYLFSILLLCSVYGVAVFIEKQIQGLIEDSSIPFDVNNLLNLSFYSYTGIVITGMMFFTLFFLTDKILQIVQHILSSVKGQIVCIFISTLIYALHASFEQGYQTAHLILPIAIMFLVLLTNLRKPNKYSFTNTLLIIAVFAAFASMIFATYTDHKEQEQRKILVKRVLNNQDPIAEIEFSSIEKRIIHDKRIQELASNQETTDYNKLTAYLSDTYFSGYFSKYSIEAFCIWNDSILQTNIHNNNLRFLQTLFHSLRKKLNEKHFLFVDLAEKGIPYLAYIPIQTHAPINKPCEILITFQSQLYQSGMGFPDLLVDNQHAEDELLKKYAFALYKNGRLIKRYGAFAYGLTSKVWEGLSSDNRFVQYAGYSHYISRSGNNDLVVLSKPLKGFLPGITTFSYLFAFYSIILLFVSAIWHLINGFRISSLNINSKIQILLVLIILTSTVLFGLGTSYFIQKQYADKNIKNIRERMKSVLLEVEHKIGKEQSIKLVSTAYLSNILSKFSKVFFTDINIYDLHGKLVASSRIQLFNKGLVSKWMEPSAFHSIRFEEMSSITHRESIGSLDYLSAYAPFKNKSGKVLGYINLPYFARQGEIEHEISSFLIALINIYVFLFALSVIAALLISNFVTSPLRKIQYMLGSMELGKSNKLIKYNNKDEIGQLVKVYNDKVIELQKSAELLAKSERESAWREMAKQVAHEIKNPLTPMKLSVQQMMRTLSDSKSYSKDDIEKFSKNIIEQIDTLSHIADEFSHFAKMPAAHFRKINLASILKSVADLFKDANRLNMKLQIDGQHHYIKGDNEQINRVMINLIKNAFQSVPSTRKAEISVWLGEDKNTVSFRVTDNGEGIPQELHEKIFSPNFTTKSSGMGMGLVMVKNIIENHQGKIWFETELGKGSSFCFSVPKFNI